MQEPCGWHRGTRLIARRHWPRRASPAHHPDSVWGGYCLRIARTIPAVLLVSLIETQIRGRHLSYLHERRYKSDLAWASVSASSKHRSGWAPSPSTDAADTSSNTLTSQRENIAALEVV